MSLNSIWNETAYNQADAKAEQAFWEDYLPKEKAIYEYLLGNHTEVVKGNFKDLAERFSVSSLYFSGFLSGINDSLVNKLDLDHVQEDTDIVLEIDFENLYYRMLELNAEELFKLPQWDAILTNEKRSEIRKQQKLSKTVVKPPKVGRNEPCPCGSGKKYKHCCGKN
jgi:preprotein translocase subunit SecA